MIPARGCSIEWSNEGEAEMTLGMRIRLWARQAPRLHVVGAALTAIAVVAALVVAAVPEDTAQTVAAGSNNPLYPGLSNTAGALPGVTESSVPAAVGAGATAPGSPAAAQPGAATATPAPGRVSPGAAGGTTVTSGPLAVRPGGTSAGGASPSAGSSSGSSSGSSGGAPAPGVTPTTGGPVARAASDQGVTAETIKVGFLLPSFANLDAAGFAFGQRQDREAFIKAYVDDVNKNGGIHGRKVVYTVVKSDPFSAAAARQSCIKLTTDEKVFGVLNSGGALGSNVACYADAKVPNIFATSQTVSEALYRKGNGYLVAMGASGTRSLLNWALFALDTGAIGPGKGKLGVLSDECPPDPEMMEQDFKPFLRSKGVDVVEARVSCDLGLAQQQVPGAVLQMRQAGVTQMFFAVLFPSAQSFLQQAEAQGFKPKYHVSDFWALNTDFSAKSFPASAFDRTKSISFSHSGEESARVPYSEAVQRCSKILTDAGLPGISNQMGADAEAVVICDAFTLWAQAAKRAPVNLTRADWVQSLSTFGPYAAAYAERAVYAPGKFNGGDSYSLLEWRKECSCWFQIRKHEPARV
jgi:ABC-type branched-subunit amino acid transport system substrate-binding protein